MLYPSIICYNIYYIYICVCFFQLGWLENTVDIKAWSTTAAATVAWAIEMIRFFKVHEFLIAFSCPNFFFWGGGRDMISPFPLSSFTTFYTKQQIALKKYAASRSCFCKSVDWNHPLSLEADRAWWHFVVGLFVTALYDSDSRWFKYTHKDVCLYTGAYCIHVYNTYHTLDISYIYIYVYDPGLAGTPTTPPNVMYPFPPPPVDVDCGFFLVGGKCGPCPCIAS